MLVIPKNYLLALFIHDTNEYDYTVIPKIKLPDDISVIDVHYDPCRLSFLFLLKSESFLPTLEGMPLPEMYFEWQSVKYIKTE